jgi:hypothetical protein
LEVSLYEEPRPIRGLKNAKSNLLLVKKLELVLRKSIIPIIKAIFSKLNFDQLIVDFNAFGALV